MQELLLDTIRGLLYYNFPKNPSTNKPFVYDKDVNLFDVGKLSLSGLKPPHVVIYGTEVPSTIPTFGTRQIEHTITIEFWAQDTKKELSERLAQEGSRIIYEILLPHKRMWMMSKCPLCLLRTLSPTHYLQTHGSLLQSYADEFATSYAAWWNTWNANQITYSQVESMLPYSRLSAQAWEMFWADVCASSSNTFSGLTDVQYQRILDANRDLRRPIMELYDCNVTKTEPSDGGEEQQFLYKGVVTLTGKRLVEVTSFGPDGATVPTEAI